MLEKETHFKTFCQNVSVERALWGFRCFKPDNKVPCSAAVLKETAAVSISDVSKTGKLTPNDVDARVRLQARMKICKCDFEVCGPFKLLISVAAWEVKVSPGGKEVWGNLSLLIFSFAVWLSRLNTFWKWKFPNDSHDVIISGCEWGLWYILVKLASIGA